VLEVSALVRGRLQHLGAEGRSWLDGLERMVSELESDWGCRFGNAVEGGSTAFIANAVDRHGRAAILKVAIPRGGEGYADFEREALVLSFAEGPSYVEVFEVDHQRRAILLERLGSPLAVLGLTVDEQIEILAATVQPSWRQVSEMIELPTGADQARWLGEFIARQWHELGEPCSRQVLNRAIEFVENRLAAFDRATAVLIHGDAHSSNVLLDPTSADGQRQFKMIDPEGIISEPAHELAIPLRGWTAELLAGDVVELSLQWCNHMSDVSGVDAIPIWEWAFVERVSTGLLLLHLGDPLGREFLGIATECTTVCL
jgi:streptomycin 6-kinase